MALVAQFARSMKPVVDLVYPPRCPSCGDAIADQVGLCADCWASLDICEGGESGAPVMIGGNAVPIHAATIYNDTSRRLVLAFKHGGRIVLAGLLGRLLAARLPDPPDGATAPPILVPVPLHRWRLWQRGYNQASLLADELARQGKGQLLVDGLVRRKRTPSLGGLGREARERALAGAIVVNPARATILARRKVILIDDVFTSGATSRACIAALSRAGVRSISVACFARVQEEGKSLATPANETPEAF